MRDLRNGWIYLMVATIGTGCGGGDAPPAQAAGDVPTAGRASPDESPRLTSLPPARRWSGIQTCEGSNGGDELETTSEPATIGSFTRGTTRVEIAGVSVGPSPQYSCDVPLDFEAVVTNVDDRTVNFESASSASEKQSTCTSMTGRPLLVGWLDGYAFDFRTLDGTQELNFTLRLEEPVDPDAGVSFSRVRVRCTFDLKL